MLRWALQEKNRQEAADAVAMNFGEQYVKLTEHDPNPVSTSGGGAFKKTAGGIFVPVQETYDINSYFADRAPGIRKTGGKCRPDGNPMGDPVRRS